mgnify:CR=1 FL=1
MSDITKKNKPQIPAFLIARVDITDPEQYRQYLNAVPLIIEKYGGKASVRSSHPLTLEGPEEKRRIVVIQFATIDKAKEFYYSPEYRQAKKFRDGAAIGEMIVVEGIAPDE